MEIIKFTDRIIRFNVADNVEIQAILISSINYEDHSLYICYSQNRLFCVEDKPEYSDPDMIIRTSILDEYVVIPKYDKLLQEYYEKSQNK